MYLSQKGNGSSNKTFVIKVGTSPLPVTTKIDLQTKLDPHKFKTQYVNSHLKDTLVYQTSYEENQNCTRHVCNLKFNPKNPLLVMQKSHMYSKFTQIGQKTKVARRPTKNDPPPPSLGGGWVPFGNYNSCSCMFLATHNIICIQNFIQIKPSSSR